MEYNLFLDDFRLPQDAFFCTSNPLYNILNWEIVRCYDEFVNFIIEKKIENIQYISFDYDISDFDDETYQNEKTGYDCAKWLIDYCIDNNLKLPKYLVHSMNSVGKLNIISLLNNYKKHCE